MARLKTLADEDLTTAQRTVRAKLLAGPRRTSGGPFEPWLRSPEFADRAQALGEFLRFRSSLPPRLLELAILAIARHWSSSYEWQAHAPLAKRAGLDPTVIAALRKNIAPEFAEDDEAAVFAFVRELHETRAVAPATYEVLARHLTETQLAELVGVLGYYTLISMTLNVFDIEALNGEQPFEVNTTRPAK